MSIYEICKSRHSLLICVLFTVSTFFRNVNNVVKTKLRVVKHKINQSHGQKQIFGQLELNANGKQSFQEDFKMI